MRRCAHRLRLIRLALTASLGALAGCSEYPFLGIGATPQTTTQAGVTLTSSDKFAERLIQARTFVNGSAVTTTFYALTDASRTPLGVDFNGDGRIDPVVGYENEAAGVVQILLSSGSVGETKFTSLTLDSNGRWSGVSDVAAGDIDGDGATDVLLCCDQGIVYLHNPGPGRETILREWGADSPDREFIAGSTTNLTTDEIEAIIANVLPPGIDINSYDVTTEQGYTHLELGDMDGDRDYDIVASRRIHINLSPKSNNNVPPILVVAGELQVFLHPGGTPTTGENWELVTVGRHERFTDLDRSGAAGLMLFDMDGDLDLDIVSAARDDENAGVMWFENPGVARLRDLSSWTPWRIGSLRDASAIDIADVTGDGRADVIAVGPEQLQMLLFVQPATGAKREFDWDTHPIVTFSTVAPRDLKALDIDSDGKLEILVAGTLGALRYFEAGSDPTQPWSVMPVLDLTPAGDIGLLGFGDLDGDGDLDFVCVLDDADDQENNADRVVWVRNDLR